MKYITAIIILIMIFGATYHLRSGEDHWPELKGPYLGQKPPGNVPERFAPGVICTDLDEYGCTFSPDGKQFYFTRTYINPKRHKILVTVWEDTGWSRPREFQFKWDLSQGEPQFSPDGKKIFFGRLEKGADDRLIPFIWVASCKNGNIYKPQHLMAGMYATASLNGNLYFTDVSQSSDKYDIAISKFQEGKYLPAQVLGGGLKSPYQDAHPFVAADERYIIFDSNRPGGLGDNDLYICFRKNDGSWGEAINLGEPINSREYDAIPYISSDRKYLFFYRTGDIYWVDAKIIEELMPDKLE